MQVTLLSDRIVVTQRGGSTTLLGRYMDSCRYSTAGGTPPGDPTPYYTVSIYFDAGRGPVNLDTGLREDTFVIDLREAVESQRSWTNTEQGAQNAILDITPILRAEECCGTPGAVIAVNAANCQNLFDPTWGLTQAQLTECVIPGIDFCDDTYKDALTEEQVACICDFDLCAVLGAVTPENVVTEVFDCLSEAAQEALLEAECECDPVDVEVNGTFYATEAAGGTEDVPVVNTAATPVGVVTAGVNVVIPDSTITRPDGTTVGLPATTPLDVRNYRSGIVYQFGDILHTGQTSVFRTGDEGTMFAGGFFNRTMPVYPEAFALLASPGVLIDNNKFSNTTRLTDTSGGAAATSGDRIIVDNLTGVEIFIPGTLPTAANWEAAIDAALASTVDGGGWTLVTEKILELFTNYQLGTGALNYAPFNINVQIWTGTTNPANPAQARFYNSSTGVVANQAKSNSTISYIFCRKTS
jgi:hypothetical protein